MQHYLQQKLILKRILKRSRSKKEKLLSYTTVYSVSRYLLQFLKSFYLRVLQLYLLTQHKSAFEDAGNGKGHEEPQADEHDVVDWEGGSYAGHDLDDGSDEHRRATSKPSNKPK